MTDAPLTIGLPSKGRLKEQADAWLADCGFTISAEGGERGYRAKLSNLPNVQVQLISAGDIATALDAGDIHLGVTGEDLLRERGEGLDSRVMLLRALGFGRADLIVDFKQLDADIKANRLPNFAVIVPNQCNEMHGLHGAGVPADCDGVNTAQLIARGDRVAGALVKSLQSTAAWRSSRNVAIIITFDEGSGKTREGCCAVTPDAPSNFGGGHIPTIVITNHGPRGLADPTPYNHYSLLRTLEDAFGVKPYLGHAADADKGVQPMVPLFATAKP
jgi:hypothetical protein